MTLLLDHTLSPTSHSSYASGYRLFSRFASMSGIDIQSSSFLSPLLLLRFIAFCHTVRGLQSSTIRSYLAAIRFFRLRAGFSDPFLDQHGAVIPQIKMALLGARRLHFTTPRQCKPISLHLLFQLVAVLRQCVFGSFDDALMHVALTTAFWGFFRSGELFPEQFHPRDHLTRADVTLLPDRAIIHLKSSKTDHFRRGVDIFLFRTGDSVCPVRALVEFVRIHPSHSSVSPFFCTQFGQPFTRSSFVSRLKHLLVLLRVDPSSYSGHSLRVGAATSAAVAGVPDHLIQVLGRWSSLSYLRYIRVDPSVLHAAQSQISSNARRRFGHEARTSFCGGSGAQT